MATSAQQATFAAQNGVNWADPNDANFGKAGYINQGQLDAYNTQYPGSAPSAPAAPSPSGPAGPITTAGQVSSGQSTVGGSAAQGSPTTVAQSFQQALVNRMNPAAPSVNDPSIAPSIQANSLAEQRGFERNQNLLAERAAANGTSNSGGFESGLLGLAQDRAAREGQFNANAVQHLSDQQNQNATSAAGMTAGLLTGQQSLAQQLQLADLDAQLKREGMSSQTALGQGDLALRSRLGEGQLNLGLLSALMGNDQFGQQLGQNASQFGANLDQQGLLALLGGL